MTKPLSATVLALRDPLDTYVQAKAALDEAQRRFHAAQNALESYRKTLGDNGQGTGDDTLLQTLTEEVVQRRATRQEVAQRREDAANRVRTLLAEAAAKEGIGESPREEPLVERASPPTEPAESTTEKPVEAAEAASSARESSPKEPQVPAKSSGSVASDEQGEPTEQDDESALVEAGNTTGASGEDETKEAADEDEEPSFSALLDESHVAVDDNAAHRAQSEPANDPAEDETPKPTEDEAAEPSEPPTEDTASASPVQATSPQPQVASESDEQPQASASPVQAAQTATDDEDLWGALLAEEGEDGSFQPEAAA